MNSDEPYPAVALLCDAEGAVRQIMRDDLELATRIGDGGCFSQMVDASSRARAEAFLAVLREQQMAFGWEMAIPGLGLHEPWHFAGGMMDGGLLIVGISSRLALALVEEEAAPTRELRPVRRPGASVLRDDYFYEELSRTNNELANVQRALASKNADLAREIEERKRAEAALQRAHNDLVNASRAAGMAEIATNVLHNVGNVLNSVNISLSVATDKIHALKVETLARVAAMLRGQQDLAAFLTNDERGRDFPEFLNRIAERFSADRREALSELEAVRQHLEHINEIVSRQQDYANAAGVTEALRLSDLIEDALRLDAGSFERHGVQVIREYADAPPATVDRHKALQILVNLIRNANYALDEGAPAEKRLSLRLTLGDGGRCARIAVSDNGVGIPTENLTRIFEHGFTTRAGGHGFGLHSGANAAREMGGSLTVQSDGPGCGATFTFELRLQPHPRVR